jgi:hypothetical protein
MTATVEQEVKKKKVTVCIKQTFEIIRGSGLPERRENKTPEKKEY